MGSSALAGGVRGSFQAAAAAASRQRSQNLPRVALLLGPSPTQATGTDRQHPASEAASHWQPHPVLARLLSLLLQACPFGQGWGLMAELLWRLEWVSLRWRWQLPAAAARRGSASAAASSSTAAARPALHPSRTCSVENYSREQEQQGVLLAGSTSC